MAHDTQVLSIPIDKIYLPETGTGRDDLADTDLDALAQDIKSIGLINPIHVETEADRYKLLAGSRRLRAARILQWTHIPALIHDAGAGHLDQLALSDNLHRRNLTPIEQATLIIAQVEADGLDIDQLSQRLGRPKNWLQGRIALLGYDPQLQTHIHHGQISLAAAKILSQIPDDTDRHAAYRHAADHGCSTTTARVWLTDALTRATPATLPTPTDSTSQPPPPQYQTFVTCFRCTKSVPISGISRQPICETCITELATQAP